VIDLAVVGGGPAGLAAAIAAARAGAEVVVFEPHEGAIDKACGEGLMPSGVRVLHELGVEVEGYPFAGVHYHLASDLGLVAKGDFHGESGLGVRRVELHRALHERAAALGVRWVRERVRGIEQRDGTVHIAGIVARSVVAADGLHSPVRRALHLDLPERGPPRYGVRRHFQIEPWSDHVEVTFAGEAEAYVTPVAATLVGVAFLYRPPARFEDLLERFPRVAERLATAEAVTPPRGAGPFRQRVKRRVKGRVLLAGDAAGYVDPLTGEGVSVGMASGVLAADCALRDKFDEYDALWSSLTRNYRMVTSALLAIARRPALHRPLVRAARALPGTFDRLLTLVGGTESLTSL
jgi:flavin-dependent dehydrogenase